MLSFIPKEVELFLGMYNETGASVNEDSLPADGQHTGKLP